MSVICNKKEIILKFNRNRKKFGESLDIISKEINRKNFADYELIDSADVYNECKKLRADMIDVYNKSCCVTLNSIFFKEIGMMCEREPNCMICRAHFFEKLKKLKRINI